MRSYPTLAREFQGFRVWGKFVFQKLELTDTPTNQANQVKLLTNYAVFNRADLRKSTVEVSSPTLETVLRGLIDCIYFLNVGWKQQPILIDFFDTDLYSVIWT